MKEHVLQEFKVRYGSRPEFLVQAPGRVNLIGEHTDYNDGFVLPMAIDRFIWIALRPRTDRRFELYSIDYDATLVFDLEHVERSDQGWAEYVKGVAWALQEAGHALSGWEGVIGGNVPIGAGLSSSAALEMGLERAFAVTSGLSWDPTAMALLAQRVDHRWVGINSGIMDQMVVGHASGDAAVLIDCRSLEITRVPLPGNTRVVVMDTGTRRGLVDSAYNERRRDCERAAEFFGVKALRDVDLETFEAGADGLDYVTRRRARHVITENTRTLAAADAMRADNARRLGELMNASHESLRTDYEVSSRELDVIVTVARAHPACLGARMTGAGFGGCAVALVEAKQAADFAKTVAADYEAETHLTPQVYICRPTRGVHVVAPDGTSSFD